mmetsp:Transcript_26075/g.41959  ORF Transcript_26075/g.41959 Transcript_26075/m.41959 type:complete len:129 (+) Transcript_26075:777-1163(+)
MWVILWPKTRPFPFASGCKCTICKFSSYRTEGISQDISTLYSPDEFLFRSVFSPSKQHKQQRGAMIMVSMKKRTSSLPRISCANDWSVVCTTSQDFPYRDHARTMSKKLQPVTIMAANAIPIQSLFDH